MEFADWKWIRTMTIWAGIVALAWLIYPIGWGIYWEVNLPETGLKAVVSSNTTEIGKLVLANETHEEEQQKQYEDVQKRLKDLRLLWGLAVVIDAGDDESWVAINVSSPAVRLKQGQELKITNTTDGERSITTVVNGTFKAGREYLLRLSAEAGREIEASRREIQIIIEPVEEESD